MDKCKKCKKPVDNSLHEKNPFIPKRDYCPECDEIIGKFYRELEEEEREAERRATRAWYKSKREKMYFNRVKRR